MSERESEVIGATRRLMHQLRYWLMTKQGQDDPQIEDSVLGCMAEVDRTLLNLAVETADRTKGGQE